MSLAIDFNRGLEDAWSSVATFVPKFVGFLVILVVGYFVAKAIARVVDGVLERVGFDRAVERGGIRTALARSNYDASDLVSKIAFYALFLLVLQLAFGVFGPNPISDGLSAIVGFLPKLAVAIVLIVVASAIGSAVKDIVGNALGGLGYGRTLANAASITILAIGVFMALNQIDIAPEIVNGLFYATLAAIVGVIVVAVGGGGIATMSQQWQKALRRVEDEMPRMRAEMTQARRTSTTEPYPTDPTARRTTTTTQEPSTPSVPR